MTASAFSEACGESRRNTPSEDAVTKVIAHLRTKVHNVTLPHILSYTSYSKRTVQRSLASLTSKGRLKKTTRFSDSGVCLPTSYELITEQLSPRQPKKRELPMSDRRRPHESTERLSQCQNNVTVRAPAHGSNIYIYAYNTSTTRIQPLAFQKTPLSTESMQATTRARVGWSVDFRGVFLKETKRKRRMLDEKTITFYRLFFSFLSSCKDTLLVELNADEGKEHGFPGLLDPDLEEVTRDRWRALCRDRGYSIQILEKKLHVLADYLRSGNAFQCREHISLRRLVTQRGLLDTLLDEALVHERSQTPIEPNSPVPIQTTNESTLTPTEEDMELCIKAWKALGREGVPFWMKNIDKK